MRRFIARALVVGTLAAAPFAMASQSYATDNACQNQPGDVDVLDVVGVDQYDPPSSGNGIVAVCHPFLGGDTYSGARVDQDASGTCIAVIVAGTSYGCTAKVAV